MAENTKGTSCARLLLVLVVALAQIVSATAISMPTRVLEMHRLFIRGGTRFSPFESNKKQLTTLGELEEESFRVEKRTCSHYTYEASGDSRRPRPLTEVVIEFFGSLKKLSPTLHYISLSVLGTFLLWQVQIPQLTKILQNHFVCNRHNVIRQKRVHAAFLSAISHSSLVHMLLNLYGLFTFGPSVRQTISPSGLPLWPFVFGASLFSSVFFLALSPHGGCLGLSGVTLAMLAFYARANPSNVLGFMVGFIPIRMPAEYALTGIIAMSLLGVLAKGSNDGVAHATHLGGLSFGVVYFELFVRGWLPSKRPWFLRLKELKRTLSTRG